MLSIPHHTIPVTKRKLVGVGCGYSPYFVGSLNAVSILAKKQKKTELPRNFRFSPEADFYSERMNTKYLKGNTYNCADIPRHETLRELCAGWLDEGLISITPVGGFIIQTFDIPNPNLNQSEGVT